MPRSAPLTLADPTKLAREQLFTTVFIADIDYQNMRRSQHIEALLAQLLASQERATALPKVEAQLARVNATATNAKRAFQILTLGWRSKFSRRLSGNRRPDVPD
jgi:hypothetical protein